MRIGIDIRSLLEGRHTGVEEYTLNLLRFLFRADHPVRHRVSPVRHRVSPVRHSVSNGTSFSARHEYILFSSGRKVANSEWPMANGTIRHFPVSNRLLNLSFKSFGRPYLDKLLNGVDVFWTPNINLVPTTSNCKKVVTFHDLSFERHPEFFSLKRRLWHKFINPKKLAHEANIIIAVSESTKQDLVELYKVNPQKIKVIYSGVNKSFLPAGRHGKPQTLNLKLQKVKKKYNLPDEFILYLGTIEPRKNLVGLIKAYEILKSNCLPRIISKRFVRGSLKLVIAGTRGWLYENIFKIAQNSKYSKDIIFTGFIEDKDKPYLYNLATAFIYPSFFEGFGFPPLEAMACGVPTITSNCSSLPEVVGDGAIMVDPYKPDELTRAMEMILTDENLRQKLSQKAVEQAGKFSWEKCAKHTLRTLIDIN